jgi:hypothetical protein
MPVIKISRTTVHPNPLCPLCLCGAFFLVLFWIGGCAHVTGQHDSGRARLPADTLVRLFHSQFEGPGIAVRQVVRDPIRWRRAWIRARSASTDSAPPAVDFSRQMVIIAGMGSVPSTGFELFIDSVVPIETETLVFVRSTSSGSCPAGGMEARPVDIVRVPRTTSPVQFMEETEVHRC